MRRVLVPMAALCLSLVTACGGAEAEPRAAGAPSLPNPAAAAAGEDAKQLEMANVTADCMKRKGFQYVPHVTPTVPDQSIRFAGPLSVLEPPADVRTFRTRYGFGVYAKQVFPNDPMVAKPKYDHSKDPNDAIRRALDPARRKAYDLALNGNFNYSKNDGGKSSTGTHGCGDEASEKVYGAQARQADAGAAEEQRAFAAFQADPEAVAAARKYADCLRGKGYRVTTDRPGEIENAMFNAAMDRSFPGQDPNGGGTAAPDQAKQDPAELTAALKIEIKAALEDLDCRTGYADLVRTKHAATLIARNQD